LGHRKFETGEPELFLFGETNDINFLNRKPVSVSEGARGEGERERERESQTRDYKPHTHTLQFPYKQPGRNQPIRCLRSYINIHRDSVKLKK
jgi:hypothetical protein